MATTIKKPARTKSTSAVSNMGREKWSSREERGRRAAISFLGAILAGSVVTSQRHSANPSALRLLPHSIKGAMLRALRE